MAFHLISKERIQNRRASTAGSIHDAGVNAEALACPCGISVSFHLVPFPRIVAQFINDKDEESEVFCETCRTWMHIWYVRGSRLPDFTTLTNFTGAWGLSGISFFRQDADEQ